MRKLAVLCTLFILACFCGVKLLAQEAVNQPAPTKNAEGPVHFYHLEFVVQELGADSKPANSRVYTVDANTDRVNRNTSIRTGSRVPIPISGSSFQYVDLGVNIDVRNAHEVDGKLALEVTADVSGLATPSSVSTASAPVIRTNRWQSPILIPLNKEMVVFTSDSLDSKGSMQIQVTAKSVQ
jgi:hypothetical protein